MEKRKVDTRYVKPAPWYGHHRTHADNQITRAGFRQPWTPVSALLLARSPKDGELFRMGNDTSSNIFEKFRRQMSIFQRVGYLQPIRRFSYRLLQNPIIGNNSGCISIQLSPEGEVNSGGYIPRRSYLPNQIDKKMLF